jgi:hypothetical protein
VRQLRTRLQDEAVAQFGGPGVAGPVEDRERGQPRLAGLLGAVQRGQRPAEAVQDVGLVAVFPGRVVEGGPGLAVVGDGVLEPAEIQADVAQRGLGDALQVPFTGLPEDGDRLP